MLKYVLLLVCCLTLHLTLGAVSAPANVEVSQGEIASPKTTASETKRAERLQRRSVLKSYRQQLRQYRKAARQGPKPERPRAPNAGEGMAVASLVMGILGVIGVWTILLGLPFAILAIIFGSIARKRYNEGYHDRRGLATAGLVLGILGAVLPIAIFSIIISTWGW